MVGLVAAVLVALLAGCVDGDIPSRPVIGSTSVQPLVSAPGCGDIDLAVVGGTLFWTEKAKGTVKSIPTTGGATTLIASNQVSPGAIAADDAAVYWISNTGKIIATKARAGGAVKVLVAATMTEEFFGVENNINALLVDGGRLFFGRYTWALKIPTVGGVLPTVLGHSPETDLGQPGAFALDGLHLYQTEKGHPAISRETIDGKQVGFLEGDLVKQPFAPDRIAVSRERLLVDAIALWSGKVIWADGPAIAMKSVDARENDPLTSVATLESGKDVTGFAVSEDVIYFGEATDGTIQKVVLPAGDPSVIATNQKNPRRIVADALSIYWRTDDCAIMKLAK